MTANVIRLWLGIVGLTAGMATGAWAGTIERLYVLHCGRAIISDLSRWTPGVNEGVTAEFGNSCYLLRHADGVFLWETGVPDGVAAKPAGVAVLDGLITLFRDATLADQLATLGLGPDQIDYVAVSHTHGDHVGNLALFPNSTIVLQRAEYDAAYAGKDAPLGPSQNMVMLDGDWDVFGDGAVTVIATPGHTAGHQSLLVRLADTGNILISGDAVHLQLSWDNKYVPAFNFDKDQTLASIDRLAAVRDENDAQLWITHDKAQTDTLIMAPAWYE